MTIYWICAPIVIAFFMGRMSIRGKVPNDPRDFCYVLSGDKIYETVSGLQDGDSYVGLVRERGKRRLRVVRVKDPLPEVFTLIKLEITALSK